MEPLDPKDSLWKLLGHSREVKVRSRFVQSVVREARQTAQDKGGLARLADFWRECLSPSPTVRWVAATAAALALSLWAGLSLQQATAPANSEMTLGAPAAAEVRAVVAEIGATETPLIPEVETQLESLDHLDALLALEDTSGFTDSEIAYLLY